MNKPDQPVVKVSWERAVAFCQWLSEQTGLEVSLPTESQWEWACRAGSIDPFWYGKGTTDFTAYENLADVRLQTESGYRNQKRWHWRPALSHRDDGYRVAAPIGSYQPNPWGLYDMHGNVAEWTLSAASSVGPTLSKRLVCGGSWADRPKWAAASERWAYPEHQKVYNVGFRVVVKDTEDIAYSSDSQSVGFYTKNTN